MYGAGPTYSKSQVSQVSCLLALNFVIGFKDFKLVFFKLNNVIHSGSRGGFFYEINP